jgi:hypothetical protein
MNALQYLHELQNDAHLHESCLDNVQRNYMRRVAAYNRLYEQALSKEARNPLAGYVASASAISASATETIPSAHKATHRTPKVKTISQLAEMLQEYSRAEKVRLEQCPSLKWTWGIDVTLDDIAKMFRTADRDYALPHSRYDCSLSGPMPGEESDFASLPPLPNATDFSSVHIDDVPLISNNNYINHHFREYPLHCPESEVPSGQLPTGSDVKDDLMEVIDTTYPHQAKSIPVPASSAIERHKPDVTSSEDAAQAFRLLQQEMLSRRQEPCTATATDKEVAQVEILSRRQEPRTAKDAGRSTEPHSDAAKAFNLLQVEMMLRRRNH